MQSFIFLAAGAVIGYLVSISTWPAVHTSLAGAEARAARLRGELSDLAAKMRGRE
jgi:hypothetical protein